MFRMATALIYTVLVLMLLSGVVGFALPWLLDLNRYKTEMADWVMEMTGRKLEIQGNVSLALFPGLGLNLRDLSLGNATGFDPEPMLRVSSLELGLELGPLLGRRVVVNRVVVSGLGLLLERDHAGRVNWADLVALFDPTDAEEAGLERGDVGKIGPIQAGAVVLAGLSMAGLDLSDTKIRWRDRLAGIDVTGQGVTLKIGPIEPNRTISVALSSDLAGNPAAIKGHVALNFQLSLEPERGLVHLHRTVLVADVRGMAQFFKDLSLRLRADIHMDLVAKTGVFAKSDLDFTGWAKDPRFREVGLGLQGRVELAGSRGLVKMAGGGLTVRLKADTLPPAGLEVAMTTDMVMDLNNGGLRLDAIQATGPAHLRFTGHIHGRGIPNDPIFQADLKTARFDPRALLPALGRTVPVFDDPQVLNRAALGLVMNGSRGGVEITRMAWHLDDTHMTGHGRLEDFKKPTIQFDIQGDTINLDRYLKKQARTVVDAAIIAPETVAATIPRHYFKTLALNGRLRLANLQVAGRKSTDLLLTVVSGNEKVRLDPHRVRLYGGVVNTLKAAVTFQGTAPHIGVQRTYRDLDMETLLQDRFPERNILSGTTDMDVDLQTFGSDQTFWWKNLSGTVKVTTKDGLFKGVDVVDMIRKNYLSFKEGRPGQDGYWVPIIKRGGQTPFSQLRATVNIADGRLENSDLLAYSPEMRITGSGMVDFAKRKADYTLAADLVASLRGLEIPNIKQFKGLFLPVHFRGPFETIEEPVIGTIDFSSILRSFLKTQGARDHKLVRLLGGWAGAERILDRIEKKITLRGKGDPLKGKKALNTFLKDLMGF